MGWFNITYTKEDLNDLEKELQCWEYIYKCAISDEELDIADAKIEILKDTIRNLK